MTIRRTRQAFSLALAALLFGAAPSHADLDVTIPPGSPTDWTGGYAEPSLTFIETIPHPGSKKGGGSVEMLPLAPFTVPGGSFGFSGVLTPDMPGHLTFTAPASDKIPPKQQVLELSGTGAVRYQLKLRYQPPPSFHMHWLSMATMMRTALHPAQVSNPLVAQHLMLIGDPAYQAARGARREAPLKALARAVMSGIGPMSRSRPSRRSGTGAYGSMLSSLALAELASGHPYAPDVAFAPRLRGLGTEVAEVVIDYSRHSHAFVRRNATALLGNYPGPKALERLRELAGHSDPCTRNRALQALFGRKDRGSVKRLKEMLKSRDIGLAALAADGLGRIGDPAAAGALKGFLESNSDNPDALWTGIAALARVAGGKDWAIPLLAKLESRLRARPNAWRSPALPANWAVDVPDRQTKAEVLAEACMIGRVVLGDTTAHEALWALVSKQYQRPGNVPDGGIILSNVAKPNKFLACDALTRLGDKGRAKLLEVLGDLQAHATLRSHALDVLDLAGLPPAARALHLRNVAMNFEGGPAAAKALERLARTDSKAAVEQSRAVVEAYAGYDVKMLPSQKIWIAIPAMRILGRNGAHTLKLLKAVVAMADAELAEAERLRKDQLARSEAQRKQAQANAKNPGPAGVMGGGMGGGGDTAAGPVLVLPPVLEVALAEIGRSRVEGSLAYLVERLKDTSKAGRAACCLGLAASGETGARKPLIEALDDADPWVRLAAYRGLRHLSGLDFACNWLYGGSSGRQRPIAKYTAWAEGKPVK